MHSSRALTCQRAEVWSVRAAGLAPAFDSPPSPIDVAAQCQCQDSISKHHTSSKRRCPFQPPKIMAKCRLGEYTSVGLPLAGGAWLTVEQCVQQRVPKCNSSGAASGALPSTAQPPNTSRYSPQVIAPWLERGVGTLSFAMDPHSHGPCHLGVGQLQGSQPLLGASSVQTSANRTTCPVLLSWTSPPTNNSSCLVPATSTEALRTSGTTPTVKKFAALACGVSCSVAVSMLLSQHQNNQ
mmetsp:Transcript_2406/g.4753  ORF Transcript_2406/g.4753 Transcript_2406/m.4753 type:complete len:239 (-) Transcript_2406:20-736(-)